MIKTTDYLKAFSLEFLVDLINEKTIVTDSLENEGLYDLRSYGDFHFFTNQYGLEKAYECQSSNRYWLGGMKYQEPKPVEEEVKVLLDIIDREVSPSLVLEHQEAFEKYLKVDEMKRDIGE